MTEILLYGTIGQDFWDVEDSITAKSVMNQLPESGPVTVRISSGGGDVYEGIDIMNALRGHDGEITVIVESLAASAASFIAVGAADVLVMRPESEMMIHKAWTFLDGNADQIRKTLADLDRQDVKLAQIYAERAGGEVDEWLARMSDETWYTADEAVAAGLADRVENARKQSAPAARVPRRIVAKFKYANRSAAPPPPIASRSESGNTTTTEPSDGQNGDKMSILNQLAQELGKKPEDVQNALSGFFNEVVPITGEVEVSYPADTKIVPTEKIKVAPIVGDKPAESAEPSEGEEVAPVENAAEESAGDSAAVQLAKSAGLTFAMGDVAEGFTAEVDEGGTVTVKAPSGAEVGSTAEFTVLVNETAVPLSVTVRSLDEEEGAESEDPADAETEPASAGASTASAQFVSVPKAHFDYLNKLAANFGATQAKIDAKAKEDRVVKDIADGRFSASNRADALRTLTEDPKAYENSWGKLPKNTIPRAEIGYGVDPAEGGAKTAPTKNPFSKPKV